MVFRPLSIVLSILGIIWPFPKVGGTWLDASEVPYCGCLACKNNGRSAFGTFQQEQALDERKRVFVLANVRIQLHRCREHHYHNGCIPRPVVNIQMQSPTPLAMTTRCSRPIQINLMSRKNRRGSCIPIRRSTSRLISHLHRTPGSFIMAGSGMASQIPNITFRQVLLSARAPLLSTEFKDQMS